MSTWVNAADHDCTLAYVPILSYVVVETKKVTLGELGHVWSGSLKAGSIGVERLRNAPAEWSQQFEALGLNPR